MPDPYLKTFTLPDGNRITSVVIDREDFDELCDQLVGVFQLNRPGGPSRSEGSDIQRIRDAGMLPMMSRGTKTEQFFAQFGVQTDLMMVCVRGTARRLMGEDLTSPS